MENIAGLRIVGEHLELYQRQAAAEEWKRDHAEAMSCRNLEELLSMGLALFDELRRAAELLQDAIARGRLAYDPRMTSSFAEAYERWLASYDKLDEAIRQFESKGYRVEYAERFRRRASELASHAFDAAGLLDAAQAIKEGRGLTLAAALDELRNHCRPERV